MDPARLLALSVARTAVTLRSAIYASAVGKRDAAGVDQMRAVLGAIAIDDQRVAQLQIVLFHAAPRECARRAGLAAPVDDLSVIVFYIQKEIGVGVRPIYFGENACQPNDGVAVELRRKGVVRADGDGGDQSRKQDSGSDFKVLICLLTL